MNEGALQIKLRELSESLEENKEATEQLKVSLESTKHLIDSSTKQTSERIVKTEELIKSLDSKTLKKEIKIYLAESTRKKSEVMMDNFEVKLKKNISELEERLSNLLGNVKGELTTDMNKNVSYMMKPFYNVIFNLFKELVIEKNKLEVEPSIFPTKGEGDNDGSVCVFDFSKNAPQIVVGNEASKFIKKLKFKVEDSNDPNCRKGTILS